jgi:4-amino-4-deoxy-L-arabinose transferase-like glycosyltransferase
MSRLQCFFVLLAIAMMVRHPTFFPLSIDSDEATYMVMAHEILQGAQLYVDVIDIKPPGIFIIFGAIEWLFGQSVMIIRLVGALVVAFSAYFLMATKLQLGLSKLSAWISALAFIFIFNFYFAAAINTEHFFVLFSAMGYYFFAKHAFKNSNPWLSGLAFGIGFIIKPLVLFEFAAIGLLLLIWWRGNLKQLVLNSITFGVAFAIPFALVHLYFLINGNFAAYTFITYVAPGNYAADRDLAASFTYLMKGAITMLPFIILGILGLIFSTQMTLKLRSFWLFASAFTIVSILAPGKTFPHYWLQYTFLLAFATGEIAEIKQLKNWFSVSWVKRTTAVVLFGYASFLTNFYYNKYVFSEGTTEKVYQYLSQNMLPNETLYTANGPTLMYYLLDKKPPTPYVHGTLLTSEGHTKTLEIDPKVELEKIFSQQPTFVLIHEPYPYDWVVEYLTSSYIKVSQKENIGIWKIDNELD